VNECSGTPRLRKPLDVDVAGRAMAGEVRKGERIPRRTPPEYSEADSFAEAISRDGLIGTLLDDRNQYGPVGMMIVLIIVATITGGAIKVLSAINIFA